MKIIKIIVLAVTVSSLFSSCADANKENTVYCFSMVFENTEDKPSVTLFCKSADAADSGESKESDISVSFYGDDFRSALVSSKDYESDIYFNSTQAIYFSENVSYEDKIIVALYLLNNSRYQTGAYVYSPQNESGVSNGEIHEKAKKVCSGKRVPINEKDEYCGFSAYFINLK